MPSTTTNWSSTETWQRLVAAIVATGVKLDLHEVAKMYGTTYDTIQNRYRKIRKEANELKEEVDSGQRPDVVATPKKGRGAGAGTPRKGKDPLGPVTNGRVTKSTPSKKAKTKGVKLEKDGADEEDIFHGLNFGDGNVDVDMDGDELTF